MAPNRTAAAVLTALALAAVVLVLIHDPRQSASLKEGLTTPAPLSETCLGYRKRCKQALSKFAAETNLKKEPGSQVELNADAQCQGCSSMNGYDGNMRFSIKGNDGNRHSVHAFMRREPDGSITMVGSNFNGDKAFNKLNCKTRTECVGAWGRMLGVYYEKAAPAVTPGAAAELKADSMARQFTELPIPVKWGGVQDVLDLYLVKDMLVNHGINRSTVSEAEKAKYAMDIIAVRPRKGSAIAKRFDWADVDRVYLVQSNRSVPDDQSLARWTAARKAAGRSTAPEDFSRYMIHTELFQLMQMQAFLMNAGELLLRVLPKVSKLPPASLTRLTTALQTVASKPGGPAMVHQGPKVAIWAGTGNYFGVAVKLSCNKKLVDDANSTSLHGGCDTTGRPLVAVLLHEYTHLLSIASKDEFVRSHNYGYWAFFRFLQLALVEAGLLNHNWRLNAKNYDAKSYGGFDPYFQRDWAAIKREVLRVGDSQKVIGDNRGGANQTTGTNWDDLWAGVEGELADKTIMARLQELESN